jgi:hypothetical protein
MAVHLGTKQGDVQQCVDVGAKREVEGFVGPIGSRALHESAGAWGQGFLDRDHQNEKVRGVFILPAHYCERSVTGWCIAYALL